MEPVTESMASPLGHSPAAELLEVVRNHQVALLDVLSGAPAVLVQSPHLARLCVELAAATRSFFDASRSMLAEHAACDSDTRVAAAHTGQRKTALGRLVDEALTSSDGDTASARRAMNLMVADGALELPRHERVNAVGPTLETIAPADVAEAMGLLDSVFPPPQPDVARAVQRISRAMEDWWVEQRQQRETVKAGEQARSVITLRAAVHEALARLDEVDRNTEESLQGGATFSELLAELECDEEALDDAPLLWQEDLESLEARQVPLLQLDGAGLDSFWPGAPGRPSGRWRSATRSVTIAGAR